MSQVYRLSIKMTEVQVYVHHNTVHILDLDIEGSRTVTNAMDTEYIGILRSKINRTLGELTILMYHTDGMITEFDPYQTFKHVDGDLDRRIYKPFKEVVDQRKR